MTRRGLTPLPLEEVVENVNTTLRGWTVYFHYRNCSKALLQVKEHAEQRLRTHLRKRHKIKDRGTGYLRFTGSLLNTQYGLYKVPTTAGWTECACLAVKNIGKPCAGKPYARFDERGLAKDSMGWLFRHRQTKGAETDMPIPTETGGCTLLYPSSFCSDGSRLLTYRPGYGMISRIDSPSWFTFTTTLMAFPEAFHGGLCLGKGYAGCLF
jgi:hypothetical protein